MRDNIPLIPWLIYPFSRPLAQLLSVVDEIVNASDVPHRCLGGWALLELTDALLPTIPLF